MKFFLGFGTELLTVKNIQHSFICDHFHEQKVEKMSFQTGNNFPHGSSGFLNFHIEDPWKQNTQFHFYFLDHDFQFSWTPDFWSPCFYLDVYMKSQSNILLIKKKIFRVTWNMLPLFNIQTTLCYLFSDITFPVSQFCFTSAFYITLIDSLLFMLYKILTVIPCCLPSLCVNWHFNQHQKSRVVSSRSCQQRGHFLCNVDSLPTFLTNLPGTLQSC